MAYTAGQTFTCEVAAPTYSTTTLGNALTALFNDVREWGILHVIGVGQGQTDQLKLSASAALAAVVVTRVEAAVSKYRYVRAVVEAPEIAAPLTDLATAYASVISPRLSIVYGYVDVLSAATGTVKKLHYAAIATAGLGKKPIGKDPAQVKPEEAYCLGPMPASVSRIYWDEYCSPGLDAAHFVTSRTIQGRPGGFYCTNFWLRSSVGSDFLYLQHGQVIDSACKITRNVLLDKLSADLELNEDGTLDEGEARVIDSKLLSALKAGLVSPKHVSAVTATTNRTDDVLSTQTLRAKVRVQPRFYPKQIEVELGFTKSVAQ